MYIYTSSQEDVKQTDFSAKTKQQLNSLTTDQIRELEGVFQSSRWLSTSPCLIIPRVPSVASCRVTSDVCPARKDFCPVGCDVCLVTRDFCLVICHTFFGSLVQSGSSIFIWRFWRGSMTILKRIRQEFERPWDVCPSPLMVMNGGLALTLPPP